MKHIFSLIFLLVSSVAFGCSCVDIGPPNYLKSCKNIYSSTLLKAKLITVDGQQVIEGLIGNPIEIYKGKQTTSNIYALKSTGTCYTNILVGEDYLVCENSDAKIYVSQCTYTRPMIWGSTNELIEGIRDKAIK